MEEGSEAHMETDVSSTTDDVPEAQQVSGSNGNNEMVEMVVIVEKVSDDEDSSSQQSESLPEGTKEAISKAPSPHTSHESPQKVSNSPNKGPEMQKSPSKGPEIQKSPAKLTETQTPVKVLNNCTDVLSLNEIHCEHVIDSSTKFETQKSPLKNNVTSPKNPSPAIEPQNIIQTSPKLPPITPIKDQALISTKTSPNKETQVQNIVTTPNKEPSTEKPNIDEKFEEIIDNQNIKADSNEMKINLVNLPVILISDKSNNSQETVSEILEKDHNKSISRELKSLINSAKESKIISECTQLTSKTRKSRAPLDASNTSLNASLEPEKIQEKRRNSDNSQKSNCSEKSDKTLIKRSMRSQNPEFVNKVKQFLNSVTSKVQKESDEGTDEEVIGDTKTKEVQKETSPLLKKKKVASIVVQEKSGKLRSDPYCWRCHYAIEPTPNEKGHPPMVCTVCPRTYHYKCLSGVERSKINIEKSWVCPECMAVLHAESSETRSTAMKKTPLGMLCELLKYAMDRMMDHNGVEPFMQPVDRTLFPAYEKYVVHPMDLSQMKQNISTGLYGSTEAFVADAQWILHNSIIFNTCEQGFVQSKLTAVARTLVRSCRAEMGEIEACPECYAAAHAHRPTWFTDVCSTPHVLLWAKLKGFPYWPAKGMSVNSSGLVDVRFFGAHDRAWVPAKDCYLYSEKDPNNFRTKRQDILDSMQEAEQHIRNISRKYGKFVYPPFKTQFDPTKLYEQLKIMIPSYEGEIRSHVNERLVKASPNMLKDKRSNSKSSKGSHNDGDTSEGEEVPSVTSRKMADGAIIARMEDDSICEKDKSMEIDSPAPSKVESSRKRRRSDLEEAVITIIETSREKKKKVENEGSKVDAKSEMQSINCMESSDIAKDSIMCKDLEVKIKRNEPSSTNEKEKPQKIPPIKLVISTKSNKTIVFSKPNIRDKNKLSPHKFKEIKFDKNNKSITLGKIKNKEEKSKRRRSSKGNKSLNNSSSANTPKTEKQLEKTTESASKEKSKENDKLVINKDDLNKSKEKTQKSTDSPKTFKERIQFDDDTSLAVLARKVKNNVTNNNIAGMPTISSVRSLSTTVQNSNTTSTKSSTTPKIIEVSIDTSSEASILKTTSTGNVNIRNVKELGNKSQILTSDCEKSLVGRVGVRAFARMSSPEKTKDDTNNLQVEIKSEPIDLDDADRHMEKMDLMNAFKLRPVNPSNLREVRINKVNKVVVTSVNAKKGGGKVEVRPRARKTFPQPKKPDDGRSELNSKNSMVYIPIQPPATPVPVRGTRITNVTVSDSIAVSKTGPITTTPNNNVMNTVTPPLVPCSMPPLTIPSTTSAPTTSSTTIAVPTVGQMATTVHTVPLITSVNGQWTFSLQPIMSVGVDDDKSPPLVNGIPDRSNAPASLVPITSSSNSTTAPIMTPSGPVIVPAAPIMVPASPSNQSLLIPTSVTSTPNSTLSAAPVVTPNRMVDAIVTPGEPPRLQQRPPLLNPFDSHATPSRVPVPASAGPLTAKLNQNSVKLMDFFRTLLEDSLDMVDDPAAQVASLRLQLEQTRWRHRQEVEEIKHNHDLTLAEIRSSFEKEKARLITEVRSSAQADLDAAVKLAKSKQWCANCRQEAQFYCCWNTSYCDYPCQRAHWSQHFAVCTQHRVQDGENSADHLSTPPESRLQPQPDHLPKNVVPAATPTLTVGGKVVRSDHQTSGSIIMSMEKDTSGNSKLKCLGTYKMPTAAPAQMPVIINKQVINNDDNSKKVVTSGGYLIVGAASDPTAPLMAASRRPHTIQYYS